MRTKHIVVASVAIAVLLGIAIAAWLHLSPPPPAPVELEPASPVVDVVDPEPVFGEDEPAAFEASPQGLYDDLDAAFERAGEKPAITLERVPPPALTPPQRAADEEPDEPDPA